MGVAQQVGWRSSESSSCSRSSWNSSTSGLAGGQVGVAPAAGWLEVKWEYIAPAAGSLKVK